MDVREGKEKKLENVELYNKNLKIKRLGRIIIEEFFNKIKKKELCGRKELR